MIISLSQIISEIAKISVEDQKRLQIEIYGLLASHKASVTSLMKIIKHKF